MKKMINEKSFTMNDKKFIEFYNEHGWVVLENVMEESQLDLILGQWNEMKLRYSSEMKLSIEDYENEVSQWRDLWLNGGAFENLIFGENCLHKISMNGMSWKGVRLLHDHIIAKPKTGSNKKIPWHQDSMFWPVDLPGCSTWTALMDTGINDGCLEVIDKSHLEGCEQPVDFMAKEREDFPDNSLKVQIPVSKGSTILLHSLTWHRSSPNKGITDRPAHLGLWVHADAKWRPDLVDWHPVNDHVESKPGERMEGKRFPMFGKLENMNSPIIDIHSGTEKTTGISMFDASKIVGNQISRIVGKTGTLSEILVSKTNRKIVIQKTIEKGFCDNIKKLEETLQRLWISYSAYALHRARNVYNDAYATWWEIAGESWYNIEN